MFRFSLSYSTILPGSPQLTFSLYKPHTHDWNDTPVSLPVLLTFCWLHPSLDKARVCHTPETAAPLRYMQDLFSGSPHGLLPQFQFHHDIQDSRHFFCHNQNKRKFRRLLPRPLKCKHQVHTLCIDFSFRSLLSNPYSTVYLCKFQKAPDRSVSSHTLLANSVLPSEAALNQRF